MRKYLLALTLMLLSVASFAQEDGKKYHSTDEQTVNVIKRSEYLKNPELVKTFERMFDHQEALGGVMLPGVKTSADVAREFADKYMVELLIANGGVSYQGDTQLDDDELLEMFDDILEQHSEMFMKGFIQIFLDWSTKKYGVKYPRISLTDEQAQANLNKVSNGIYTATRYKRAGHDEFESYTNAAPSYIIVNNGRSYRMVTSNDNYSDGTFQFRIEPSDIVVSDWDGTSMQTVHTCDEQISDKFAYGTQVTELLEPISTEFGQVFYSMIGSMDGSKKKSSNRLIGAWKRAGGEKAAYYKVYGDDYRMLISDYSTDSTFSIKGQYQICEYTANGSTIESGNHCAIEWTDKNSYLLKYKSGNNEQTEQWMREPLPKTLASFVKDCMSGSGNVKQLPTDPKELLDVLDAMPNCKERWNGYFRVLKMPEVNTPEGWTLKVRALIQMSQMQKENGKIAEARKLATEAGSLAEAHAADGTAEAMWYAAKVYKNDGGFCEFADWQKLCETLEMELTCLDEFRRLSAEEPARWKNELAQFDNIYIGVGSDLCECYAMCDQYKKCIFVGNKALKYWEKTSEELRNKTLYDRYNIQSAMLRSAQQTCNKQVFEICANDISAFLADVSAKMQQGEVSMDADTRTTMMIFSISLMESYCMEGDLERSGEYNILGKTFSPADSSLIDFRFCMALANAGRYEEADRLHTELLKDESFVKTYLSDGDDPIAKQLEGHVQPKEKPATTTAAKANTPELQAETKQKKAETEQQQAEARKKAETQRKISSQLASVNEKLDSAKGGNRVKIKGYTASSTNTAQARKDRNGRVALPVDSAKKAGVGIHFKF